MKISLFALMILLCGVFANAETIQFPEEELARESVLPVFDHPQAVKKRLTPMSSRVELNAFGGMGLNDPWYNSYPLGGKAAYHFNEMHAVGVLGAFYVNSKTNYVSQIQALQNGSAIPFNRAPSPSYLGLLEYEFTPYYGKISITKDRVMNLTIAGTAGVGFLGLKSDVKTDSSIAISLGLSQRFFFTRNWGINADLRAMFYQQEDVITSNIAKKNTVNLLLTVGAVYFLPSL